MGDLRQTEANRYIPELDGLRAIACLLVIVFHSAPFGAVPGGFIGVDIFFVLSGYLITTILAGELARSGTISLRRFYVQRSLRLMPALALFLLAYLAIAPVVWPDHNHALDALVAALYASDYAYPLVQIPFFIRHTWSLAIEEQFYLLWPLILPFLLRRRRALAILLAAWLGFSLWRFSFAADDWAVYYYRFDTHCTGLIAGAALAIAQRLYRIKVSQAVGIGAIACLALISFVAQIDGAAVIITIAEAASVALIGCIVTSNLPVLSNFLSSSAMVRIGQLSYGLYLWHFPIAYYLRRDLGFFDTAVLTLALSFAGALTSYYTVERWGRWIKHRAKPTGSPAVLGSAPSAGLNR